MNREISHIISECNKAGVRIYPVPKNGLYTIEIEYNKTPRFRKSEIIKIKKGTQKYNPNKKDWQEKIEQLYENIYSKNLKPKSELQEG